MTDAAQDAWSKSAAAWIASQGEAGDFSRAFVLDRPMLTLARAANAKAALDVGCGEGRFVRLLKAEGLTATGLDPTPELIAAARARDPDGAYLIGRAEDLPFPDESFDLVVSYLSLVDIADYRTAIAEMARVLQKGGQLLIANVSALNSARVEETPPRPFGFVVDHYQDERPRWEEWRGIRIVNHHRPLAAYMRAFLEQGLILTHFEEPLPYGGDPAKAERYARVPFHLVMAWRKG